jgi:hypothetical protein
MTEKEPKAAIESRAIANCSPPPTSAARRLRSDGSPTWLRAGRARTAAVPTRGTDPVPGRQPAPLAATVCAARGEPQRTREVARLDDGTVDRYSSIGARVLLLGGQKSPPVITHDLFGALGRTIACVDAEIIGGLDHLAAEELQRSSQSACGTTCPSGNSESPHLRDCKPQRTARL